MCGGYVVVAVAVTIIMMIIVHVIQDRNDVNFDFDVEDTLRESRARKERREREEEMLRDKVEQEFDRISEFGSPEDLR